MPDAEDLIHVPGEPVIVGPTVRKKELRGRRGTFVRYVLVSVMVDGGTHHVISQNVLKSCPVCHIAAPEHPDGPCEN